MALLGWVPGAEGTEAGASGLLPDQAQPRFVHNTSGRFESRWATVTVLPGSPAVLLKVRKLSSEGACHRPTRVGSTCAARTQRKISAGPGSSLLVSCD